MQKFALQLKTFPTFILTLKVSFDIQISRQYPVVYKINQQVFIPWDLIIFSSFYLFLEFILFMHLPNMKYGDNFGYNHKKGCRWYSINCELSNVNHSYVHIHICISFYLVISLKYYACLYIVSTLKADVVLSLGTRLGPFGALPQYGFDYWPKQAKIIQV